MLKKIIQRSKYIWSDVLFFVVYGVVLYFVFTWLAGYSLLYAYFGNLALIIMVLVLEEYSLKSVESKRIFKKLSEQKDWEEAYHYVKKIIDNSTSYKTGLYLFYVLLLIFAQVIDFNPALVGEDIRNFILSNNYSILLLIAIDMLIQQTSREKKRLKKISAELEKYYAERKDE